MLCSKCANLHFRPLEECPQSVQEKAWFPAKYPKRLYSAHSADTGYLKRSVATGCHFCILLRNHLIHKGPLVNEHDDDPIHTYGEIFLTIDIAQVSNRIASQSQPATNVDMSISYRFGQIKIRCAQELIDPVVPISESSAHCVVGASPTILAELQDADHFSESKSSTLSPTTLALASTWLRHCLDFHVSVCAAFAERIGGPARLLNISHPDQAFLEDNVQESVEYAALSYKWGSCKRYLTKQDNLDQHRQSIPIHLLPRTFTDAVDVTRRLGLKYLWIDALCIVQDSPDDLKCEIGRMGDIFRGSTLCISAEAGDHADAGLSVARDRHHIEPCRLNFETSCGKIQMQMSVHALQPDFVSTRLPLKERGWVLQEEVLAPRTLFFGAPYIWWQCSCNTFSETAPGNKDDWIMSDYYSPSMAQLQELSDYWPGQYLVGIRCLLRNTPMISANPSDAQWSGSMLLAWYLFIEAYSHRNLTFATDVLSAVAGVAKTISVKQHLRYTNGLWTSDLAHGLTWYVIRHIRQEPKSIQDASNGDSVERSMECPSWSWMARWGSQVKFWHGRKASDKLVFLIVDEATESKKEHDTTAMNSSAAREEHAEDVFQHVTPRALVLNGYVSVATLGRETTRNAQAPWSSMWSRYILEFGTQDVIGRVALDLDPRLRTIDHITYITCAATIPHDPSVAAELVSLALVPADQPGVYTRIGLVFQAWNDHDQMRYWHDTRPEEWIMGFRRSTITLI